MIDTSQVILGKLPFFVFGNTMSSRGLEPHEKETVENILNTINFPTTVKQGINENFSLKNSPSLDFFFVFA